MTGEQTRNLVATFVIAAAVCGGMHAMLAGPLRGRAVAAEAELQSLIDRHDLAASTLDDLPRMMGLSAASEAAADEFETRSEPARDESAMFTAVLALADRAGVTVEQLIPSGASKNARWANGTPPSRPGDCKTRYTLVGGGTYAGTADFIAALESDWGYCAVRQCRLTPDYNAGPDGDVRFSVLIEMFGFDASPIELTAFVGDTP